MRANLLLVAVLSISAAGGCSVGQDSAGGDASPASSSSASREPAASTVPATPGAPSSGANAEIRRTDWLNVTLHQLRFLDLGDAKFRNGKASFGYNTCTMLPDGARPVYGDVLAEEPANSPATEDALVLIECGGDSQQQALVLVQLAYDRTTRTERGFIPADPPNPQRMTFVAYAFEGGAVRTTVRKPDGTTERRRYVYDGGMSWRRAPS